MGRIEVEVATMLSLKKKCCAFLALLQDYVFMPLRKEDCINHVKKRMGTALCTFVKKNKRGLLVEEVGSHKI